MKGFWLHSCPRCKGDLHYVPNILGAYITCLQCDHLITARDEVLLRATGRLPEAAVVPAAASAA